jgi:hypothetical protein
MGASVKQFLRLALSVGLSAVLAAAQATSPVDRSADPPAAAVRPVGAPPTAGVTPGPLMPLEGAYAEMSGEDLFAKMLDYDAMRDAHLREYSSLRTYSVVNEKGRASAQEIIQMNYYAPDRKTFAVKSGSGSPLIRSLVLDRLVQTEKETASGQTHRQSALKPENYTLRLIGEQDLGPYRCLVAEAIPKRRDRYLFAGKVWISSDDFGIVRMAGRPARPLSFWLTRAEFVRQYDKIDGFWLPVEDQTVAQVRFYGRKTLVVKYNDYEVNGSPARPGASSESTAH